MSNNFLYRERLRIPNDNKNTYAIEIISLRNRLEQHRVQPNFELPLATPMFFYNYRHAGTRIDCSAWAHYIILRNTIISIMFLLG